VKKTAFIVFLFSIISAPLFGKTLASQKLNSLLKLDKPAVKESPTPLSAQVEVLKNDETSKGISSSVGTDKTDEFISHIAKMLKIVEAGGKFNATVDAYNGTLSIKNNGDENISKLTEILSAFDRKIEVNLKAVLGAWKITVNSNNPEIEKIFKIINSYAARALSIDIGGTAQTAAVSNESLGKYLLDMGLCLKSGEKMSDELAARTLKKISGLDLATETPADVDKVVYYTSNMEAPMIEKFKQAVQKNGGKNNKTQMVAKLDELLIKVKAEDPFKR